VIGERGRPRRHERDDAYREDDLFDPSHMFLRISSFPSNRVMTPVSATACVTLTQGRGGLNVAGSVGR
jgi:hypothetical protein